MIDCVFRTAVDEEIVGDRIDAGHFQHASDIGPASFKTNRQNVTDAVILVHRRCGNDDPRLFVVECYYVRAKQIISNNAGSSFAFVNIVNEIQIDAVEANIAELKRCVLHNVHLYPADTDAAN